MPAELLQTLVTTKDGLVGIINDGKRVYLSSPEPNALVIRLSEICNSEKNKIEYERAQEKLIKNLPEGTYVQFAEFTPLSDRHMSLCPYNTFKESPIIR